MKKQKWTKIMLREEASKYKTRNKFKKCNSSAYRASLKLNILDEVCGHMPKDSKIGGIPRNFKWTEELLILEALKYKTKKEFRTISAGAYKRAKRIGILNKICSHMGNSLHLWTNEELAQEALKYKTRGEFQHKNRKAYNISWLRDLLDIICHHMESAHHYWTDEELQIESLKYKTRNEFQKNSKGYAVARERNILDKICSHMPIHAQIGTKPHNFQWTLEKLKKEAFKYNNSFDFKKEAHSAYQAAVNNKVLHKITGHMKKSKNTSTQEKEIFEIIKFIFTSTIKLIDRRVKIKDKPYIKGFHIDIFVPELNKGIEFDGKYHHSFEYMRASRNKKLWSDDDIRNYHEMKDSWFASKGIQILHVKEEDWDLDKEDCIKKCLDFFKSNS